MNELSGKNNIMFAGMTIIEINKKIKDELKVIYGASESAAIAEIAIEYYTGIKRQHFFLKGDEMIADEAEENLEKALQRLMDHEPVQYIINEAWFYGLRFFVNKNVLIPRPETEELVDEAVKHLKKDPNKILVDIGTGSGCIPISIKKNIPGAEVISVDVSKEALTVAEKNAADHQTEIIFHQLDFLNENAWSKLPETDFIISNPPYIPAGEKEIMEKNVIMHEPGLALFVPQDNPLIFYKMIRKFADEKLNPGGKIFLETHEDLANETAAIFTGENYSAEIKKDMSGKERMLIITRL